MMTNDHFARQNGEDPSAHFARLARELWRCVDETKRQVEQLHSDRRSDLAVTEHWREDVRRRLEKVEDRVDTLRMAAGLPQQKSSIFEVDLKTLVIAAIAVGAVVYEILRRSGSAS